MPMAVAQQALGVALGAVPEHFVVSLLFGHRVSRCAVSMDRLGRDYGVRPALDAKEPHMKGSLRVAQFTARQKPFPVDFFVPIAVSQRRDSGHSSIASGITKWSLTAGGSSRSQNQARGPALLAPCSKSNRAVQQILNASLDSVSKPAGASLDVHRRTTQQVSQAL
jgi:hypothetical protein